VKFWLFRHGNRTAVRAIENTPTLSGDDDGTKIPKDVQAPGDKYEDYPEDEDDVVTNNMDAVTNAAKDIREAGNLLFKAGKYGEALDQYKKSLRYLDWQPLVDDTPPESVKAYNAQLTPLLLNMALAALKITPTTTRNAEDARNSTTRVLQLDEVSSADKAKALYRRSLANSLLQEDEDAEKDLVEALTIAPGDEAVRRELDKVRQKKKEKRDKQKKAYRGLFS